MESRMGTNVRSGVLGGGGGLEELVIIEHVVMMLVKKSGLFFELLQRELAAAVVDVRLAAQQLLGVFEPPELDVAVRFVAGRLDVLDDVAVVDLAEAHEDVVQLLVAHARWYA